ncbi:unnamed protein product [Pleuronectes platessa]|uniref:Uncharacterized protein n=1 Tax=Pleuronectes platessa TaxID=8262 RepID=A0A9N7V1G5_PLEPL|nr:unnamed protein product [Pleuronectes platessa]
MSVLTESEGDGLLPMADGKAPPRVLYVDRDCCSVAGRCKTAQMFGEWDQLVVRLDVWHLMRRLARGVTNDSHPLYGLFMSRLSFAIFERDAEDVTCLQEARQSPLDPTSRELSRHCRRRTRGAEETERLIQELLESMWDVTDGMGVPLIDRPMMEDIWIMQRRHLRCIQDPPGVLLYAKTGEVTRGGVVLPVYRCARVLPPPPVPVHSGHVCQRPPPPCCEGLVGGTRTVPELRWPAVPSSPPRAATVPSC